jgi:branched-chain amino acid transport system permease protein
MRASSPPFRPAHVLRCGTLLLFLGCVSILLAGCADLIDSDQRRLCRSLLPALDGAAAGFEIDRVDDLRVAAAEGASLRIVYRVLVSPDGRSAGTVQGPGLRTLTCLFAPTSGRAAPVLVSVVTDRGPLGPGRLHVLQRYWIDSGLAAQSDPEPIATFAAAPTLSRPFAFALQQALGSLPAIAIYVLLATAYSLIYGLVGRINLAFGDLSSLAGYGAFLGFSMIGDQAIGAAVLLAFLFGLFTAATHGGALGRLVVARLAGAPGQHVLIATIGISIFWQEAMRLTQGAGNRWISPLMNRPIGLARTDGYTVTVTPMALIVAVVAGVAALVLVVAMRRSRFGLHWRASADDPLAAAMMGVDATAILVRTMVLAALLSGLAGVLTTLFYGGVGYAGGLVIGLKALIAAIIGGIGSIHGALLGGLILGLAETVWSGLFPIEYRDPAIFFGLAVMLWLRPAGLYGAEAMQPSARLQ